MKTPLDAERDAAEIHKRDVSFAGPKQKGSSTCEEQPQRPGTREAREAAKEALARLGRRAARLEKRFQKERRLSARSKLHRLGIPTGPPADPWQDKKYARRRKPEGVSVTAFITGGKKTIAEQVAAMDRRMFGRGQAPWDDPEASDSVSESSDSASPGPQALVRAKTPEYLHVIQGWRDQ